MTILRSSKLDHAFARGHSALRHVKNPEGWVRGKAVLDTQTGNLEMVLGLETDSTSHGVRGRMSVRIFDAKGVEVAYAEMTKPLGIPGKEPGPSRIEEFSIRRSIPLEAARRAAKLKVSVTYDGAQFGIWGIPLKDVVKAVKIVIATVAAA